MHASKVSQCHSLDESKSMCILYARILLKLNNFNKCIYLMTTQIWEALDL